MATRKRSLWSVRGELIEKSREAALSATRVFNDPMTRFKSESYIVLMVYNAYLVYATRGRAGFWPATSRRNSAQAACIHC